MADKSMERCSTSLIVREMSANRATVTGRLTPYSTATGRLTPVGRAAIKQPQRKVSVGGGVGLTSVLCWRGLTWCSHYGTSNPLLGLNPKE